MTQMEGKKVIFVGGTSYSGSTFFDMILGNDPKGFSCGEVNDLLYPHRPHHFNPECSCGDEKCNIWKRVLRNGEDKLYETIFDMFPNVEFITDSSKDPYWIHSRTKRLRKENVEAKNVLIWKTPLELAHSLRKRDRTIDLHRYWENYHRLYFTLIKDWRAVKYSDLVQKRETLEKICEYLGIPYYRSKHKYWDKKHHTLFGNTSAKLHLYKEDSNLYKSLEEKYSDRTNTPSSEIRTRFRKIYYEDRREELMQDVNDSISSNKIISLIESDLCLRDLATQHEELESSYHSYLSKAKYSKIRHIYLLIASRLKGKYHYM